MLEQFYFKRVGKMNALKSDTNIGFFILLVSILFFAGSFSIKQSTFSAPMATATFFPRVVSILLAISSINLIIKDYLKKKKSKGRVQSKKMNGSSEKYVQYMIGATAIYILLIPIIGYLISTIIYMISSCLFLGAAFIKKRWVTILIAISISVFSYLLFTKILIVLLPSGVFI